MEDFKLFYRGIINKSDRIVFFENNLQALCSWSFETNCIEVIGGSHGIAYFTGFEIFEYKNEIIIVSNYGQRLLIWNMDSKSFTEMTGDFLEKREEVISQCILLNSRLYMIYQHPSQNPIIIYDLELHEFYASDILQKKLEKYEIWAPFTFSTKTGFLGMNYKNELIFEVDLEKESVFITQDTTEKKLLCVGKIDDEILKCYCNSYDVFSDRNGIVPLTIMEDEECKEPYSYMNTVLDGVVILPRFGHKITYISKEKNMSIDIKKYVDIEKSQGSFATSCFQVDKDLYLCPTFKTSILKINLENGTSKMIKPILSRSCLQRMLEVKGIYADGIVYEKCYGDYKGTLSVFLDMINLN